MAHRQIERRLEQQLNAVAEPGGIFMKGGTAMKELNEIVEVGRAQELILGGKDLGGADSGMEPFRLTVPDSEEDE
jgi:hypothetical protein